MWSELILLLGLLCLVFYKQWWRKCNRNYPPGPFKWPVIGNILEISLINHKNPHLAMEHLSKKFGGIMSLHFGSHLFIVVSCFEDLKGLFTKTHLSERFLHTSMRDRNFNPNEPQGIIFGLGKSRVAIQKFTLKALGELGMRKPMLMNVLQQEEVREFISCCRQKAEDTRGIIHIQNANFFSSSSVNIVWSLVAGKRFASDDPLFHKAIAATAKTMEIFAYGNLYDTFPVLGKWFPRLTLRDRHLNLHVQIRQYMKEILESIKSQRSKRLDLSAANFIELFLDEVEKNKDNPSSPFTDEQLIMVMMDLFLAGSESVGTALNWTVLFLTLYPEVQEQIHSEIMNIVSGNEDISQDHFEKLPFVRATIYETLRFSVLAPHPAPRVAVEDIWYKDMLIPKGAGVMWNLQPIYMDKDVWGDPETFRPNRFLDMDNRLVQHLVDRVNGIFGFGSRTCMGDRLTIHSLFLYTSNLVRSFFLEVAPGHSRPSPKEPTYGLTLVPKPYRVKLTPRPA